MMGEMINKKLIKLIRDRPCLYDLNHRDSNSFNVKEEHWIEIAKKLCLEVTFVKKRWKVIRDRYRKEWIKIKNDPYGRYKSTWRHYKDLSYLAHHMTLKTFTILPKFEAAEDQSKFVTRDYDEFSEFMEVLESEHEGEEVEHETILKHSQLIESVKSMPNLYNPQNHNYNNILASQLSWQQVAKDLESSVGTVKLNWEVLYDLFCQEHKNVIDYTGTVPEYVPSFQYYDQLSFLIDCVNLKEIPSPDLKEGIVNCVEISNENGEDDDISYQYLKEEEVVSSETIKWLKLDDRDSKLIQLIQNNPILYDVNHPNYKDVSMRNRKWTQISLELDQDVTSMKSRWQAIEEQYRVYLSTDADDPNTRKIVEMLGFLDQNSKEYDSDSVSNVNIKYEIVSNENVDQYIDENIHPTETSVISSSGRTRSSLPQHNSPSTVNAIPNESPNHSHVKMFFDCVTAQIEAENLPFRYFSIIQQEVLKVVHEQITNYLDQQ